MEAQTVYLWPKRPRYSVRIATRGMTRGWPVAVLGPAGYWGPYYYPYYNPGVIIVPPQKQRLAPTVSKQGKLNRPRYAQSKRPVREGRPFSLAMRDPRRLRPCAAAASTTSCSPGSTRSAAPASGVKVSAPTTRRIGVGTEARPRPAR